jgi:hypothetical protein
MENPEFEEDYNKIKDQYNLFTKTKKNIASFLKNRYATSAATTFIKSGVVFGKKLAMTRMNIAGTESA